MVEIIPKPVEKIPFPQAILFYFSIFLLIALIISYFVLGMFEKNSEIYLQDLEEKISQTKTPEIISLEKEVLDYQRKINDFAKILEEHTLNSRFFEFLEKKTYPKIFFQKINLNPQNSAVMLSGQTDSFLTLGYQVQILQKEDLIKNINLSKISIGKEGKIEFTLDLNLDPKMLSPR